MRSKTIVVLVLLVFALSLGAAFAQAAVGEGGKMGGNQRGAKNANPGQRIVEMTQKRVAQVAKQIAKIQEGITSGKITAQQKEKMIARLKEQLANFESTVASLQQAMKLMEETKPNISEILTKLEGFTPPVGTQPAGAARQQSGAATPPAAATK